MKSLVEFIKSSHVNESQEYDNMYRDIVDICGMSELRRLPRSGIKAVIDKVSDIIDGFDDGKLTTKQKKQMYDVDDNYTWLYLDEDMTYELVDDRETITGGDESMIFDNDNVWLYCERYNRISVIEIVTNYDDTEFEHQIYVGIKL